MQTMNSIGGWENVLLNQTIPTLRGNIREGFWRFREKRPILAGCKIDKH